jgi:hypothetical protein
MKRKFPRTHQLVVTVTFNKGCRRAVALREVKAEILDEYWTKPSLEPGYPDAYRIRSVVSKTGGRKR